MEAHGEHIRESINEIQTSMEQAMNDEIQYLYQVNDIIQEKSSKTFTVWSKFTESRERQRRLANEVRSDCVQ